MQNSDVFVSYRRKDVDFAKKITEALKATGREIWVDWEDIPPGVEGFSDEIQRGIEGANAMVAILSPNYIESEYCIMELREALRLKKRVIPIILQKFEPTPPPEGIGHINWVYFCPHAGQENPFDEAFKKVILALEADYEHSREHTRLLLRAIEWDKRQKNPSYVLKGAEIEKAEGWQMTAVAKNPSPTSLQSEYIHTSRKIQRRQQQRFMGVIGVLLVLAAIAAVVALFQAGEARRQEGIALTALAQSRRDEEIAQSHALSAAAQQPGNEPIAVALALEATRSEYVPEEIFKTLQTIAYRPGSIHYNYIPSPSDAFPFERYPAVAPDGQFVVVLNQRINLATGQVDLEFPEVPAYILTGVYLPDGKHVILAGDDEAADASYQPIFMGLYDAETGDLVRSFDTGIGVSDIQLSGDSKVIISYLPNGKAVWWDIETGEKLKEFDTEGTASFSPDLKWMGMVAPTDDPYVMQATLIDTETDTVELTFPTAYATNLRFSSDSTEFTVATRSPESFRIPDGALLHTLNGHFENDSITSLRYSKDGSKIVTASSDGTVIIWQRSTGQLLTRFRGHSSNVAFADFVRGDKAVISADVPGTIMEWDVIPGNLVEYNLLDNTALLVGLSADGHSLIFSEGCDIVTREAETLKETVRVALTRPKNQDAVCYPIVFNDPNGGEGKIFQDLLTLDDQGMTQEATLEVSSMSTGQPLQTWTIPRFETFNTALFLPDGQRILLAYTTRDSDDPSNSKYISHIELRDIASGKLVREYPALPLAQLALSPDGTRLLMSSSAYDEKQDKTINLISMLSIESGKELLHLDEMSSGVWFTPDGKQFITTKPASDVQGRDDYQLHIWDVETGTHLKTLPNLMPAPAQLIFSSDGKSVFTVKAAVGAAGVVRLPSGIDFGLSFHATDNIELPLWSLETGDKITSFPIQPSNILPSPNGTHLFTVALTDDAMGIGLYEWRLDTPESLIAFVCSNRYIPVLTALQREQFLIDSETSVCPTTTALAK